MKMKKNKKAILVVCLAVCMMSFTACGSKSDKVFELIDKGSYSEALDYYKDKIDGDSKERDLRKEIKKGFSDHFDTILEQYNNDEVDEKEIKKLNKLFDELKFDSDDEDYAEFKSKFNALKESKEYYAEALEMMEEKEYQSAIRYFGYVIEDDSKYEDAQAKIEEIGDLIAGEKLTPVKEYLDQKQYGDAVKTAYSLRYDLEGIKAYEDMYKEAVDGLVKESDAKVEEFFKENDYNSARSYLSSLYSSYYYVEDIEEKYENLEDTYADYVVKESKALADKGDYEKAAAMVKAASSQVRNNDKINTAYETYKVYVPVYLHELTVLSSEGTVNATDYDYYTKDNTNKEHQSAFWVSGWGKKDYWAEYYLDGSYTRFSGVCGLNSRDNNESNSIHFEVYGDDKLIYTSPSMTKGVLPEEFTVDITGVKVLKIFYPANDGDNSAACIFDGTVVKEANKPAVTTKATTAATSVPEVTTAVSGDVTAAEGSAEVTAVTSEGEAPEVTTAASEVTTVAAE